MGTVTVTTAGFATLPATPPSGWPPGVTYPGAASTNGSHVYTLTDADWVRLITWTAASQFKTGSSPTALQILLAWVQVWWTGTQTAEQQYGTPAPVPPPPIVIS